MPPHEVYTYWDIFEEPRKNVYNEKQAKNNMVKDNHQETNIIKKRQLPTMQKENDEKLANINAKKYPKMAWSILIVTVIVAMLAIHGLADINSFGNSLQNQIEDYKAERRIEFVQNGNKEGLLEGGFKRDPAALAAALELVDDLVNDGEAGFVHMGAISDVIGRPIEILDDQGHTVRYIGDSAKGKPIEVQYHPPKGVNPQGHWTLPGGKEPEFSGGINDCLFDVVANQTGGDSRCLRADTVWQMIIDLPSLADRISDIDHLKAHKSRALLEGGAAYSGRSATDARNVLDNSQGRRSAASTMPGHPRAHASNRGLARVPRNINCVENYSYGGGQGKTAFMSSAEQDIYVHQALISATARAAIQRLNNGSTREQFSVPMRVNAGQWKNGRRMSTFRSRAIRLVLEHHVGQQTNRNSDVFVRTAYPTR